MNVKLIRSPSREAFNKVFFDHVRHSVFRGLLTQTQVTNLNHILDAFELYGDGNAKSLAYILATVRGEVGSRMAPVREGFADTDAEARRAVRGRAYGEPTGAYGHVYYGRGYVQLTWFDNYKASSRDAGVDLVANPDAMLEPEIAAKILVLGVIDGRFNAKGKGIQHYLPEGGKDDLKNARRTVNITDRWQKFASFYNGFYPAVVEARKAFVAPDVEVPVETPDGPILVDYEAIEQEFQDIPEDQRRKLAYHARILAFHLRETNTPATERGFLSEKEETMGNLLSSLPFNGNKTNIGILAWAVVNIFGAQLFGGEAPEWLYTVIYAWTGVGAGHKLDKVSK